MHTTCARAVLAALIAILFACSNGDRSREETISLGDPGAEAGEASAYWNNEPPLSMEDLERGRLDSTWLRAAASDTTPLRLAPLDSVAVEPLVPGGTTGGRETAADASGPEAPADLDRTAPDGPTVLEVQVLLDRSPFSPGILDGKWGKNTRKAVYWLQRVEGLEATGEVDSTTLARLVERAGRPRGFLRAVRLDRADLSGPFVDIPADVHAQAELECMCYGSALEKLAERWHASPELLERLNPGRALDSLAVGDSLVVPAVEPFEIAAALSDSLGAPLGGEVARIVVSVDGYYLHALDSEGRLLHHFPATLGSRYQPSPSGALAIASIAFDPPFHWQPALFDEVPDSEPDAHIPPGPNSPVGVVWIALTKDDYGIHGTAEPATIGYATSHGCVRLTNWDARLLAEASRPGVPVVFRDLHADAEPVASAGR
jgi:lipoprotein-anchoring transpeptidase ErfK/SrfK